MCLLLTLGLAVGIMGCSGWSVMGYALDEEYSPSVFQTIVDQDSILHYYNATMYSGQMWCYKHSKYEEVKVIRE